MTDGAEDHYFDSRDARLREAVRRQIVRDGVQNGTQSVCGGIWERIKWGAELLRSVV